MILRIGLTTPKGQATGTEQKLRKLILGRRTTSTTYVSPENDSLYWEVDVPIKQALKIQANMSRFQTLVTTFLDNKTVNKALRKAADNPDDIDVLRTMFTEGTSVTILKTATAEELVEANKTRWQRIKETFTLRP